ncbi:hypothetical protein KEM60_02832 [Austwickia sp. TVS 96-490-7B]|nr:hypothetical protein [Austwickia sp. TVS 96-490-7B]
MTWRQPQLSGAPSVTTSSAGQPPSQSADQTRFDLISTGDIESVLQRRRQGSHQIRSNILTGRDLVVTVIRALTQ